MRYNFLFGDVHVSQSQEKARDISGALGRARI